MSTLTEKDSRVGGRWTKEQHQQFLMGLEIYGRNWKKIQEFIGTRNGSQIRSHAQKFFLRVKKTFDGSENGQTEKESYSDTKQFKILQKKKSMTENENIEHSFFMNQILKMQYDLQSFNFWEMLVDTGDSKSQGESTIQVQRKNSFVMHYINESRHQTPIDNLGINLI